MMNTVTPNSTSKSAHEHTALLMAGLHSSVPSPSLSAPAERLRILWRRLAPLPGGKALFTFLLGRMTPYSGSIGARVEELEPGLCRVTLRDRRRVRNHLGSIHAMALANLAEMASGLAVLAGLPATVQGIVTGFSITYLKKARGRLSAECRAERLDVTAEQEYEAAVALSDAQGDVVARATARWRLRPTPNATTHDARRTAVQ
jgi:uncharacterized protein (TIGR00369 family)